MFRTVEIRYRLMRAGGDDGEIHAIEGTKPMLRMDDAGEIKTSLSGVFAPAPEANWLTDEIRPELVIDGSPTPLGVFLPTTVIGQETDRIKELRIEAYDRCWLVREHFTETILSLAAGTNYMTAVEQLLTAAGITLVIATPTTATLTEIREDWDIGTSYLTIINDLLREINYKPLHFNAQGYAMLVPIRIPTAENIDHVLDSSTVKSLLLPYLQSSTDMYQTPNVWLVVCSNPDKSGPMVARAVNDNPESPLSTVKRGRQLMSVEFVNNIASQDELQAYANLRAAQGMYVGEVYTVQTALLPGYGVEDITALRYDGIAALCIERAWTMELQVGGTMTHRLEKVVPHIG